MSDTYVAGRGPVPAEVRVARVAAGQLGLVARAQVVACGLAARTAERRCAAGLWQRIHPGVYRIVASPDDARQPLLAACLAWGDGAVASHRAAAALWGLPGFPVGRVELIVPRSARRSLPHLVHRVRVLPADDVTRLGPIPVTTPARTLMDLAGCARAALLEEALDDALRRGLVSVRGLGRLLDERGRKGRPGAGRLAEMVAGRSPGSAVPQSVFETRVLRVLREAGMPLPVIQHEIRTPAGRAVVDFAYRKERLAIEADGYRFHSSRRSWDHDRARRNALSAAGWTVVHVTWTELKDRPDEVVATLRSLLAGPSSPASRRRPPR